MRFLPTPAARIAPLAAVLALSCAAVPAVGQNVVINDDQVNPDVFVPVSRFWLIRPTGSLDTGAGGSVRSVVVEGVLQNEGDLKVGFSSESSGLQVAGRLDNFGFSQNPGQPARLQAAQGRVGGRINNVAGNLITGSYTDSRNALAAPLTGTTFASPGFGPFVVERFGVVENQGNFDPPGFRTTWTNHSDDLRILGRVSNSGFFESRNAPTVSAFPPATSYLQRITIGEQSSGDGWFDNEAGGEVELRAGTTLLNQALFTNAQSGTVTVRSSGVLEVAGAFGEYRQSSGGTTVVDFGGMLRTRESGQILNAGTITIADEGALENNSRLLNNLGGVVTVAERARIDQGSAGEFENTGRLDVEGTFAGGGPLSSSGQLNVLALGVIDLTAEPGQEGAFTQVDGATVVDGLLRAGAVEFLAGTVGGSGVIEYTGGLTSAVTFGAGLTVQPGNSPGILTVNGNLEAAGAIFDIEVAGRDPGTLFDQLVVNGDANLTDATVNFRFLDGFLPAPGDTFNWLAVSGFVAGLDTLSISFFSDAGTIGGFLREDGSLFVDSVESVTPVPLPPAAWALCSALLGLGAVARRRVAAVSSA